MPSPGKHNIMDVSECEQQVQVMLITVRMHDCNNVDFNQINQSSVEITLNNMSSGAINISIGTDQRNYVQ